MKRATKNGKFGFPNPHFFTRGKVQGKVFYVRNNKQCVRALGNMDEKRFWSDEKFANSQGTSREFGASAMLSGTIRNAFGDMATDVSPRKLQHNKLTKKLIHTFIPIPGKKGSRTLPGGHIAAKLQRFAWDKNHEVCSPYGYTKNTIDAVVFKPRVNYHLFGQTEYPDWVTHVQPVFKVVAISDMIRRKNGKKYYPANRALHGATRTARGPLIPVADLAIPQNDVKGSWRPDLVFPEAVEAGMGLITAVGFEMIAYRPDGEVFDRKYATMQTSWSGTIAQSMMEARIEAEKYEEYKPIRDHLATLKPLIITYDGPKNPTLDHEIAKSKRRRRRLIQSRSD